MTEYEIVGCIAMTIALIAVGFAITLMSEHE